MSWLILQGKMQLAGDSYQQQAVLELNQSCLSPSSHPFCQPELAQCMPQDSLE
jgi:hypothetical protein